MPDYRPSKRPSVNAVKTWYTVFEDQIDADWRGLRGSVVIVQEGYPYPDFYKVRHKMGTDTKWTQKLFYGESAYYSVQRYVSDLGFLSVYASSF